MSRKLLCHIKIYHQQQQYIQVNNLYRGGDKIKVSANEPRYHGSSDGKQEAA